MSEPAPSGAAPSDRTALATWLRTHADEVAELVLRTTPGASVRGPAAVVDVLRGGAHGGRTPADRRPSVGRPHDLDPVALTALELAAHGLSDREIGERLHYSVQAVTWHLARVRRALGARNRTELVARAFTVGLLVPGRRR